MTGLSGNAISSFRMQADLSVQGVLKDEKGILLAKRNGIPVNAGLKTMAFTFG